MATDDEMVRVVANSNLYELMWDVEGPFATLWEYYHDFPQRVDSLVNFGPGQQEFWFFHVVNGVPLNRDLLADAVREAEIRAVREGRDRLSEIRAAIHCIADANQEDD